MDEEIFSRFESRSKNHLDVDGEKLLAIIQLTALHGKIIKLFIGNKKMGKVQRTEKPFYR